MNTMEQENIKTRTSASLIDACINLDISRKLTTRMLNAYKAELQARGLSEMDDHNLRSVEYYGNRGSVTVMDALSLDILNPDKLRDLVGDGTFDTKVRTSTETKYKCDARFERMLKAVFTGDYDLSTSLEELLDSMTVRPDPEQKKLLLKKLKGDFKKDRDLLTAVLTPEAVPAPDWEAELFCIYQIKNAELIRRFLPEEFLDETIANIRKCILVDSKLSITLNYEEDGNDE